MPPQQVPPQDVSGTPPAVRVDDTQLDAEHVLLQSSSQVPFQTASNNNGLLPRRDGSTSSSFLMQFVKMKGPPQITFLMMLIAIGLGSTIGVVPAVMTDRFARLNYGYDSSTKRCSDWGSSLERPEACYLGNGDAQSAVAASNMISNVFTFVMSSWIGSLSDEYGRKGILILGLFMGIMPPFMLLLIQVIPTMSPWWYYGFNAATGVVNWVAVALSSLADVLPQRFRAPGIGLLLAGFMLGFSFSPILAFLLTNFQLSLLSLCFVILGLIATIIWVPETLDPRLAEEARQRRQMEMIDEIVREEDRHYHARDDWLTKHLRQGCTMLWKTITRPVKEMSILNRDSFFRLISLLAFFSGMVSSGDQILLVYYLEERLAFTTQDISKMFLIMGVMGLLAQGVLLKPLNELIGEKRVVAFCFFVGAVDNVMYGLAQNKSTIFAAVALSALTGMAFPTISAIKANNVAPAEQGRIQGALYSLQALASGLGPVLLRFVYSQAKESPLGPGSMFVFAALLYLVAVAAACALPPERANAPRPGSAHDDGLGPFDDDDEDENTTSCQHGEEDEDVMNYHHLSFGSDSDDSAGARSYGSIQ